MFTGGIEIVVPRNVSVICDGTVLPGGVDLLGKSGKGIIGACSVRRETEDRSAPVIMF